MAGVAVVAHEVKMVRTHTHKTFEICGRRRDRKSPFRAFLFRRRRGELRMCEGEMKRKEKSLYVRYSVERRRDVIKGSVFARSEKFFVQSTLCVRRRFARPRPLL